MTKPLFASRELRKVGFLKCLCRRHGLALLREKVVGVNLQNLPSDADSGVVAVFRLLQNLAGLVVGKIGAKLLHVVDVPSYGDFIGKAGGLFRALAHGL